MYSRSQDLSNVYYEAPALLIAVITFTAVYSRSIREGKVCEPEKYVRSRSIISISIFKLLKNHFLGHFLEGLTDPLPVLFTLERNRFSVHGRVTTKIFPKV